MNNNIKISVIVASYNYEKYIRENLQSLIDQTYKNFEVIIFDDGSKDNSLEIIREFVQKDERFKLFTHKNNVNLGLTFTIQKALEHCTGEYVAFCESDDYWDKNHLQKKVDYLIKNPSAEVIVNDFQVFGDNFESIKNYRNDSGLLKLYSILKNIKSPAPIFYKSEIKLGCWVFPTFSIVMVKRKLLEQCKLNAPSRNGLDIWLFKQLMLKGNVGYVDEKLTYFRRSFDSNIGKNSDSNLDEIYFKSLNKCLLKDVIFSKPSVEKIIYFYKILRRKIHKYLNK